MDDSFVFWPEDREIVELGRLTLTKAVPNNLAAQQHIMYNPANLVRGIESSGDPLMVARQAIYQMSGRRRRAAPSTENVIPDA